jgi:drug/metabolite transporter (DMT)-like permease
VTKARTDLALVAAFVTVGLWASAFVGIRDAGHHISPGALSLARLVVATLALGALVAVKREPMPARADLPRVAFVGLLWLGAYNVLLNAAERHVDAGTAAMLVNIGPVLIAILAGVLLKEGFPRSLFAGCAVAFAGVALIGIATSQRGIGSATGVLECLGAAVAYSVAVVAQKPLLARTSGLTVTFLACAVAMVACLPFAPALVNDAGAAPASAVAWAVYLGLVPTAIGFTTWAYALKRTSAGKMGAFTYLVPPLAVLLGWLLLSETPPSLALAGGLLCLAGVAITRRPANTSRSSRRSLRDRGTSSRDHRSPDRSAHETPSRRLPALARSEHPRRPR